MASRSSRLRFSLELDLETRDLSLLPLLEARLFRLPLLLERLLPEPRLLLETKLMLENAGRRKVLLRYGTEINTVLDSYNMYR